MFTSDRLFKGIGVQGFYNTPIDSEYQKERRPTLALKEQGGSLRLDMIATMHYFLAPHKNLWVNSEVLKTQQIEITSAFHQRRDFRISIRYV